MFHKVIDCGQYVLNIRPLTKSQSKCLQLADIIASSTYQAFEPNQYDGDVEPAYYMKLSDNILGYGLKLFPSNTDIIEQDKYSWINDLLRKLSKGLKNSSHGVYYYWASVWLKQRWVIPAVP